MSGGKREVVYRCQYCRASISSWVPEVPEDPGAVQEIAVERPCSVCPGTAKLVGLEADVLEVDREGRS